MHLYAMISDSPKIGSLALRGARQAEVIEQWRINSQAGGRLSGASAEEKDKPEEAKSHKCAGDQMIPL